MQLTPRKKWVRRFKYFGLGLVLTYLALCFVLANLVVSRHSLKVPVRPKEFVVWEPVPKVPAWASPGVPMKASPYLFIFAHGVKADRSFFQGTALELMKRGYDVVLLPMPGHDENPDGTLGFGPKEAELIKATINAVKAKNIVLVGCSLGGAVSWLASDDPRVNGVVTECAFSHLEPITRRWFDRKMPVGALLLRPVIWMASAMVGLDPADVNPAESARLWDHSKPALVIQAADDKLVPTSQGEELAKASGAEYWEVPNLEHAQCQRCGKEYIDRVERVMQKVIRNGYSEDHTMPGGPDFPPNQIERRAMAALGEPIR
jgi:pimeloyl-ACP methyl ester carboxylesterase